MSASVTRPEDTALFLAQRCAEHEAEIERLRKVVMEYKRQAAKLVERIIELEQQIGPLPGGE